MEYQDVNVKCVTCGREFIFTAKEQEFFHSKGFKEPRHCRECRQQRKRDREKVFAEASGQKYEDDRGTFKVVCANCQRETFVPFKPITGKPVLCKDCFIAQRYGAEKKAEEGSGAAVEQPVPTPSETESEAPRDVSEDQVTPTSPEIDLQMAEEIPKREDQAAETEVDEAADEPLEEQTDDTVGAKPEDSKAEKATKPKADDLPEPADEAAPTDETDREEEPPADTSSENSEKAESGGTSANQKSSVVN